MHRASPAAWLVIALLLVAPGDSPAAPAKPKAPKLTGTAVVVNQKSDTITLIDLAKMEAYRHVSVVGGPHEAAASPDGRMVVVTNYHKPGSPQKTLSVIALPSGETIRTINGGLECGGRNPAQVAARIEYYRKFCWMLGVDPGPSLGC